LSRRNFPINFVEEDRSGVKDDGFTLGADLSCSNNLYKDLQAKYFIESSNSKPTVTSDYDYTNDYD